ncbi:MAG TPA: aminotransferase class V-fold PLP-dependent enzyme [Treponemataceae bacterium]|nr:aminotransferase class V-fold PLP-dependent enzyme [Treponemataceae bacterium]
MNKRVYLDYNATTPLDPGVRDVFIQALDSYANASSMHEDGRAVAKEIRGARESVAALIGAKPEEIIFTSGGSESNNTVFNTMTTQAITRTGSLKAAYGGRKAIITSSIEHPCVMESARRLESLGFLVHFLPVDGDGRVDMEKYRELLLEGERSGIEEKKPLLVSIMMANNEIGTIQDISELSRLAHEAGALFHTDAVQAVGKIPVDVLELGCDYLTMSCHKIYGPKGVGALYVRKGAPIDSLIKGGHQEAGLRAGTYNAPSIIGFGEAARLAATRLPEYESRTRALRNRLRDGFIRAVPDIRVNGHAEKVLPNTLDVSFPGAEGEAILLMLDIAGISVSTGSACASGSLEPSHVLMATGVGPELAHGSIRFSLGQYTTEAEIDYILEQVPPIIKRLRGFSTVSSKE